MNSNLLKLAVGIFCMTLIFSSCKSESKEKKTNVIFILADDLGYGDISCYGQEKFKTPNIDKLATEGIKFTDHYSGNTVCSPSRAVLMTGQHPGHVHCRGNKRIESSNALDTSMITLPRLFKNAGYATGAYGKWGLGYTNSEGPENPLSHGFDHFSGWRSQRFAHTYYPSTIVRDGKETALDSGTYIHDLIMDDAYSFIRENAERNKPFFCYIPTAIPHAAMHAPDSLHQIWSEKYPEFNEIIGKYSAGTEQCPDVQNPIAGFAAMMEHLDNQVGELFALLNELGIDDNTLIIFTSDNGSHIEGGHDPEFWNSNGPLRGHKRDMYEGGIRAPFLVRWPSAIKPGTTSNHISAFWDILPTMADIVNQEIPQQSDGISILPTLLGSDMQKEHKYLYWEFRQGGPQYLKGQAIRMGQWKAVLNYEKSIEKQSPKPEIELYNLSIDLGEKNNVADKNTDIIEKAERIISEAHVSQE